MSFLTLLILSFIILIEGIKLSPRVSFAETHLFTYKAGLLFLFPVNFPGSISGVYRKWKKERWFIFCFPRIKLILKEFELKKRKKEKIAKK